MTLPTEPIGSIPRPRPSRTACRRRPPDGSPADELDALFDDAVGDTLARFEATGSPVVTDGEQRKPSFATYPVAGLTDLAPGGVTIPFEDGHTRQLPVLTTGPFRYATQAWSYLDAARGTTTAQLKQAVISASALSLHVPGRRHRRATPREAFIDDLVAEAAAEIRGCLERGATRPDRLHRGAPVAQARSVGRAARRVRRPEQPRPRPAHRRGAGAGRRPHLSGRRPGLDPQRRRRLRGAAARPVPHERRTRFYVQLASEADRERVLEILGDHATGDRRIFVGVTDPIDPRVETPEEVRDRVLEAARFIDPSHLGTTDDCGFSPFGDDTSTSRDIAFAKIQARIDGTRLASAELGV